MNDPSIAVTAQPPLTQLLDDHFSAQNLGQLLGPMAAELEGSVWDDALYRPLADFLQRPGKEFRASLVTTSYALAGGTGPCPAHLPLIVEVLHAGSLIVDDIQDQSAMRRGRPALHVDYGLPVALNAGNWMYFWAFSLVENSALDDAAQLRLYKWMSRTLLSCHHGQGLDLTARVGDLSQTQVPLVVETTTRLKTGSLMELAALLGAVAAGASCAAATELAKFGSSLGVALQMLDDVGGLVSERRAHKGHEDLIHGRPTWPWAWLAQGAQSSTYERLRSMAHAVSQRDLHPELLSQALRSELRGSGRVRVRRHLNEAFSELRSSVGESAALETIEQEIHRLEKSYG